MKKNEIQKVVVDDEGVYECPECTAFNYLDSYDFTKLIQRGKYLSSCPTCGVKLKLYSYEPDNYTEL